MKADEGPKSLRFAELAIFSFAAVVAFCLSRYGPEQARWSVIATPMAHAPARTKGRKHVVDIADSIEMTQFGDPYYADGGSAKGIVAKFSPNGEQFVVILKKGDLQTNTNEYSLVLFRTAEVFHSPAPHRLVSMSSSSNRPAIHNVVWLNDNDTLLFLGERPGEHSQIYSVHCSSGELTRLTNRVTNLTSFVSTSVGDEIAYVAEDPVSSITNDSVARNGLDVRHEWLSDLLGGHSAGGEYGDHSLFIKQPNRSEVKIKLEGRIDDSREVSMALAPDGEHLLIQSRATLVPAAWNGYENQSIQTIVRHSPKPGAQTAIFQYELINTRTGSSSVLFDAPISPDGSEMAWSPDSSSVIVSNVYLPLNVNDPVEQKVRKTHTFLLDYEIRGQNYSILSDEDLRLIKWDPKTNVVICDVGRFSSLVGKETSKAYFRKSGDRWDRITTPQQGGAPALPEIVLDENMNTPPRIMAIGLDSGRRSLIMDLNPQFRDLTFARVEEVSWKNFFGDEVKGGLYWPVDYVAGKKYPLVIQTHAWVHDRFWIDGPWSTAFAAQALAGRGFFVLQIVESAWRVADTPREAPSAMADYESAIDYLDGKGLINRNLVGIIGFSRTCYYVTQMLAFSKYDIAAAVLADGVDAGYFQYLAFSNANPDMAAESEALNGGAPFGAGLSSWIGRVSAFHMDRVRAPVRIQALGPSSLLLEWDWFSGLSALNKPVDMVYLPKGAHILQRPWDRIVSQQGDVDWFCFWLKGEENLDRGKIPQYKRWHELRDLSDAEIPMVDVQ